MRKFMIFLITATMLLLTGCSSIEVIGQVYGPEHEYITIGEDTYTVCYDSGYSANDIDKKLGVVEFKNQDVDSMMVWSVKGVEDNEYIYTLWVQDGAFYKKDMGSLTENTTMNQQQENADSTGKTSNSEQQATTTNASDTENPNIENPNTENSTPENSNTESSDTAPADIQILYGDNYIFYKTDMSHINGTHWIKGVYEEFYQAEFHGLFVGQVLTLFGDENITTDNEALVDYAVAAENEAGEVIYLSVYYGPSGPAIGGLDGANYLEAAEELEHIIRCTVPEDCRVESVYGDLGVTIIMGTQDGRGFYETIMDESMFIY